MEILESTRNRAFNYNIAMVSGAERKDTSVMIRELERANKKVAEGFEKENGRNPITFQISQVGGNEGRGIAGVENKTKTYLVLLL